MAKPFVKHFKGVKSVYINEKDPDLFNPYLSKLTANHKRKSKEIKDPDGEKKHRRVSKIPSKGKSRRISKLPDTEVSGGEQIKIEPPLEPEHALEHKHTFEKVIENVINKVDTRNIDQYILHEAHQGRSKAK